jgi:hypothetical protein
VNVIHAWVVGWAGGTQVLWSTEGIILFGVLLGIIAVQSLIIVVLWRIGVSYRLLNASAQGAAQASLEAIEKSDPHRWHRILMDLRDTLDDRFTDEEIEVLRFDLQVDDGILEAAKSRRMRAQKLVEHLDARGRIGELREMIRRQRPDILRQAGA